MVEGNIVRSSAIKVAVDLLLRSAPSFREVTIHSVGLVAVGHCFIFVHAVRLRILLDASCRR